jgi:G:T/U-mismatch repair DNA glycosylase
MAGTVVSAWSWLSPAVAQESASGRQLELQQEDVSVILRANYAEAELPIQQQGWIVVLHAETEPGTTLHSRLLDQAGDERRPDALPPPRRANGHTQLRDLRADEPVSRRRSIEESVPRSAQALTRKAHGDQAEVTLATPAGRIPSDLAPGQHSVGTLSRPGPPSRRVVEHRRQESAVVLADAQLSQRPSLHRLRA